MDAPSSHPRRLLTAALLTAAMALFATTSTAGEPLDCTDEDRHSIDLGEAWEVGLAVDPGADAQQARIRAATADGDHIGRLRLPTTEVDAEGDLGKRVSPGAERDQGRSLRASAGASLQLPLYDSVFDDQADAADLRLDGAQLDADAHRIDLHETIARAYIDAAIADERQRHIDERRHQLQALADTVQRRIDAGVEGGVERHAIDQATARIERQLTEATTAHEQALHTLSHLLDRCVRPRSMPSELDASPDPDRPERPDSPHLQALRLQGRIADADAQVLSHTDRLQLFGVATGRLYFSPAYDNLPEPEYFAGLTLRWRPDLRGTRQRQSQAQRHRARALDDEASELHRQQIQRLDAIALVDRRLQTQRQALHREIDQAKERRDAALARWDQGVGSWLDLIDADERLQDAQLALLDLHHQSLLHAVESAALTDDLTSLSTLLDQPPRD